MNIKHVSKDAIFLKHLFAYFNIFLITPWYDFEKNDFYKPTSRKLYGSLLIIGQVAWMVNYVLDKTLHQIYSTLSITQKLIYTLLVIQMVTVFILTVFKTAFCDSAKWRVLFQNLRHIDQSLGIWKQEVKLKNLYVSAIGTHVLFILVFSYNLYFWAVALQMPILKSFWMCPLVSFYCQHLLWTLLSVTVLCIKRRYQWLNEKVREHCGKLEIIEELEKMIKYYRILGETVDVYNQLFGYQIILLIFQTGNQCLHCLNFFFMYTTVSTKDRFASHVVISNILLLIFFMYNLLVVIVAANSTHLEAKKIFDVCYRLQEHYGAKSQEAEILTKLIRYCGHYNRVFEVAGFFNLDRTIILSIVGNVATYFIIVIQLNESQYLQIDNK